MGAKGIIKKATPNFLLNLYYEIWPFFGALIYRFPSKSIKVIGVTGTNGKTTVTHLTTEIFEEAGYKVGSISSLRFKVGDKERKNELKMTMPGRMTIQKILREAVDVGCEYFILEVTSEGIRQARHKFINFDIAVFTNLTPEHIESHGSFENYKRAKGELFKIAKRAVVNLDDENAEYFSELCRGEVYFYKVKSQSLPQYKIKEMTKVVSSEDANLSLSLLGEFNLYNALASVCAGLLEGISMTIIRRALENSKCVPGRMEIVLKTPFTVVVDYAHTPDSLRKVYETMLSNYEVRETGGKKLICVLGSAGGGRDKWKRPEMGKIAQEYCDEIILTDEDPYNENPDSILNEIESGFSKNIKHKRILDRRTAIREAIKSAKTGDTVVITGKGAEPWMMKKEGRVRWDDRDVAREEIKKLA